MKPEVKVGLLFIFTTLLIVVFVYYLGLINPISQNNTLTVAYNYAGGIEVGSPIRVMGIKVGKVKAIDFDSNFKMPTTNEEVKLKIKISVEKKAWKSIRTDSQFYINIAGVIGEKFIEISPGSTEAPLFKDSAVVRGYDPPRIDQLISQSYGLAGKVIDLLEKNETSFIQTIDGMNALVKNLNTFLKQMDKVAKRKDVSDLMNNMVAITEDVSYFTHNLRSKENEETMKLVRKLIWRLDPLDSKMIRKFLQDEGIRAKIF